MNQRYTVTDLRAAFRRACEAAKSAGIDSAHWVLEEGAPSQGTMHRLFKIMPGETDLTALSFTSGNGFLGSTYKEACETLYHYASAWWAVVETHRSE